MKDKLITGLLIGFGAPIVGYYLIVGIMAIIDVLLDKKDVFILLRPSTHYLLALAFNIPAVNWVNNRYMSRTVRGIVMATLVYAGLWLWQFYSTLM